MTAHNPEWLMNWYVRECDDYWEHSYGVKIDTLDNPGWTIAIDLRETSLEGRTFAAEHGEPAADIHEWREKGSWWIAKANGTSFSAACGPTDLSSVIGLFRDWSENSSD